MKSKIRYVPRWVAETLVIPANTTVTASPTIFANTDLWPMQLHWLAMTGETTKTAAESATKDLTGGAARRLSWEIGMSQRGEINLVAGGTDAFFASNSRKRQNQSCFDDGAKFILPSEYELGPDSGLVVQVMANNPSYNIYDPGILVNGVRDEGRKVYEPAQLGGVIEGTLTYPAIALIEAADLFNSGKDIMYLKELLFKTGQLTGVYFTDPSPYWESQYEPAMDKIKWRVNPNNDIPWMPQDSLIPTGNIAPFNRGTRDVWDQGPRSYIFPAGSMLNPRQRLTIRITNRNATTSPDGDQTIVLSMFTLLEVQ